MWTKCKEIAERDITMKPTLKMSNKIIKKSQILIIIHDESINNINYKKQCQYSVES